MMITYNYVCINDDCPQTPRKKVHVKKEETEANRIELCEHCGQHLKQLGIITNIAHKGTQESYNKMNR